MPLFILLIVLATLGSGSRIQEKTSRTSFLTKATPTSSPLIDPIGNSSDVSGSVLELAEMAALSEQVEDASSKGLSEINAISEQAKDMTKDPNKFVYLERVLVYFKRTSKLYEAFMGQEGNIELILDLKPEDYSIHDEQVVLVGPHTHYSGVYKLVLKDQDLDKWNPGEYEVYQFSAKLPQVSRESPPMDTFEIVLVYFELTGELYEAFKDKEGMIDLSLPLKSNKNYSKNGKTIIRKSRGSLFQYILAKYGENFDEWSRGAYEVYEFDKELS